MKLPGRMRSVAPPRAPLLAMLAALIAAATAHAQFRPDASWRQIETQHFTIIYEAGLDSIARHAAARAEIEHARLGAGLIRAPKGRIDIVLSDNSDITNGFATPFPDKRIGIWVRPPIDDPGLQHHDDWIDLVIAHELTHVFHLDQTGRVGRALRAAFGRVPFAWPVFPLIGTPRWNIEGLATLIESRHTGAGRLYGTFHEMVVRTAVLENDFPTIDRVSGETPIWPGGTRAYVYGSLFMDYIARRYGDSAHTALIEKSAGSILPPPWRMDGIAKSALGRSFRDLYSDWQQELTAGYDSLAAFLRSEGLTEPERITTAGRQALHPRISPDGRRLAYVEENGRDVTATRILDLETGADRRVRRNGLGSFAWLPGDTAFITAQYEFVDPYVIYSDLYLVSRGRERRLTHGARAEWPDASADGRRLVYVQNEQGSNRLVVRELASGEAAVIAAATPDVHWTLPRWSPDGRRIAVQRWHRRRGHDVVVMDETGRELDVIATEGIDAAPTWTPDGRTIVFSSDLTGITNLYAYDLAERRLRQVTSVAGGAFFPAVSPDGRWLYYSGYHADGFHIERIPLDARMWREPLLAVRHDPPGGGPPFTPYETRIGPPRGYSPVRSLLPKFWLPAVWGDTALSTFVGVFTAGADAIGRHEYALQLGYDPDHERVAGSVRYTYAGLGNPVLGLEAAREWDYTGRVSLRNDAGEVVGTFGSFEREDRVTITSAIRSRRWRAGSSLLLGAEGVAFERRILGPARFRDPHDRYIGLLGGAGFNNSRQPALAISPEDGVRGNVVVRRRFELEPGERDASYTEVQGSAAAYKSTGGGRFAHEVIALRASALHRTASGRGPTDVGGTFEFLPVRGFDERARVGFTAWSASLEYRLPLALVGRGYRLRPFFIDRVAGAFFVDAGNAACTSEQRALYLACPGVADNPSGPLVSAGFELSANVAALVFLPSWLRGGIAFPLRGGDRKARIYLTLGPSF